MKFELLFELIEQSLTPPVLFQEADLLYGVMVKKFRLDHTVWLDCCLFLYKNNRAERARKMRTRCLQSVDKSQHLDVILKNAKWEFQYGDAEMAKTIFENLISGYPNRTDLMSVYIDQTIKHKDIDHARLVFMSLLVDDHYYWLR